RGSDRGPWLLRLLEDEGVLTGRGGGQRCPPPPTGDAGDESVLPMDSCRGGRSDLADEVQARGERLLALLPLGRADLAGVVADVLGGLDLADELLRVAADALGGDLEEL